MMKSQMGPALEAIETSISLDPSNPDAAFQRGNVLFASGRYMDAVAAYQGLLELEPHESRIWYNLGAAFEALDRHDEAYRAYRTSVELDPARESALANLMLLTLRADRLEEAGQWLEKALATGSKRLDVRVGQAVLLRPSNPEQADGLIEQCRALSPEGVQQLLEKLNRTVVLTGVSK